MSLRKRQKLRVSREGYHRKSYRRKDGTVVDATNVPATTFSIKDTGAPGRTPKSQQWFHPKRKMAYKDSAGRVHEWNAKDSAKVRRATLNGLVRRRGTTVVTRELLALHNVTTHRATKAATSADLAWMSHRRVMRRRNPHRLGHEVEGGI